MEEKVQVTFDKIEDSSLKVSFYVNNINKKIPAEFFLDIPSQSKSDYEILLSKGKEIVEILFYENKISFIIEEAAAEITESAYEGERREEEYLNLKNDLSLNEIHFFEEDLIITLISPQIFPKNTINVQINYSFNIEDLTIDM
jgi:hypothetical protein